MAKPSRALCPIPFLQRQNRFARYGYYGVGYGAAAYAVDDSCYRVVDTEVGPRRVNVCE